jgi:hypothetical protein
MCQREHTEECRREIVSPNSTTTLAHSWSSLVKTSVMTQTKGISRTVLNLFPNNPLGHLNMVTCPSAIKTKSLTITRQINPCPRDTPKLQSKSTKDNALIAYRKCLAASTKSMPPLLILFIKRFINVLMSLIHQVHSSSAQGRERQIKKLRNYFPIWKTSQLLSLLRCKRLLLDSHWQWMRASRVLWCKPSSSGVLVNCNRLSWWCSSQIRHFLLKLLAIVV